MADGHVIQGMAEAERDLSWQKQDQAAGALKSRTDNEKKGGSNGSNLDVSTRTLGGIHGEEDGSPTDEQRATLRRVPASINLNIFAVALIEFCERFSYYGFQVVLTNFIQRPLPPGSRTGAIKGPNVPAGWNTPGALDKGQQAAFGITTFNTFWIYVTPIGGAYVADTYLGRYKTICYAIAIAIVGHILLIIPAIPEVLTTNPNASYALTIVALVIMGLGTGPFKSNISPLIAEQIPATQLALKRQKDGDLVIVDPALTVGRVMMWFYLLVNCGSLSGQLGMVYAEQDIGFWLSFTIPTVVLCLTPFVMWWGRKRYRRTPPSGSVLPNAFRCLRMASSKAWSLNPSKTLANIKSRDFWNVAKPSYIEQTSGEKPAWMTFDDQWVEEVRRGFKACWVFALVPFYWLSYNQMTSNLTSQAATMQRNVPNDLINNLNPISLVILIPIFDQLIYPYLRSKNIRFTPIKRMTCGFFFTALAMVVAAIVQHYIYAEHPCGDRASSCDSVAPINVWVQTPSYVLIGISEIFTSITGLEYAFNKAPPNMRSLVTSMWLFTNALSAAIGQAFVALSSDPLLVVNYGVFAGLAAVAGVIFWFLFRHLDAEEYELNDLRRNDDGSAQLHDGRNYGQAPAPAAGTDVEEKRQRNV